jgi:hypothetical protein
MLHRFSVLSYDSRNVWLTILGSVTATLAIFFVGLTRLQMRHNVFPLYMATSLNMSDGADGFFLPLSILYLLILYNQQIATLHPLAYNGTLVAT